MAYLSKFFQDTCSIRNGQYAVSMQGEMDWEARAPPAVLSVFRYRTYSGKGIVLLYAWSSRPHELASLVVYHGGIIDLNPV